DETYGLLLQRQYNQVLQRVADAQGMYPRQGDFQKKYNLMNAIAIAGTGNYPEADTLLQHFVATYPNDSLTAGAAAILDYVRQQKYQQPLNPPTTAPPDSMQAALGNFIYNPQLPHIVVIAANQDNRLSALKSGLIDYNLMKAGKENLVVTVSGLNGEEGLVLCKGFATAGGAQEYLKEIRQLSSLYREYQNEQDYDLLLISEDNLMLLLQSKNLADYKSFYKALYR